MQDFWQFFAFQDPNVVSVVVGVVLLSASSAVVGTFSFLKKKALSGEAVSHAVLPGIALAFMLQGEKNLLVLVAGAFVTGWLSLMAMTYLRKHSKLKEDTTLALVLSVFFGFGILLLTHIQHQGNAEQTGLQDFIFGKAAALIGRDVWVFGALASAILLTVLLFFKELTLLCFDEAHAKSMGVATGFFHVLLNTLIVLAVVVGIQAVGVVLMSAMLITPPAAARFWTHKIRRMTLLAAAFAAFSGIAGAYISYSAPRMPTGPWIVLVLSIMAMLSFVVAPQKGILANWWRNRQNQRQMLAENLLKAFFHLREKQGAGGDNAYTQEQVQQMRYLPNSRLQKGLRALQKQGAVERRNDKKWQLTTSGLHRAQQLVKRHRLWELYLSQHLDLAHDHVHDDAETIEHIITPELEKALEEQLAYPERDPHNAPIPGRNHQNPTTT